MHPTIELHRVAGLLGLARSSASYSLLDLSEDLARGLPVSAIESVRRAVAPDMPRFSDYITPSATLKRRRQQKKPLTSVESERLARITQVWAMAVDVYRDDDMARTFLRRPHQLLHDRTPLEVAAENWPGAQSVQEILGRLKYGSAA